MQIDRQKLIEATQEVMVGCCVTSEHSGAEMVDAILSALKDQGLVIVPRVATEGMRMAGAMAITADHMRAMANYDAACDAWSAMIEAATGGEGDD